VLDVQPKLAARVRVLDIESGEKSDAHDARSVAVAAPRSERGESTQNECAPTQG